MCLKVLGKVFQRNFQGVAFLVITAVFSGCSSGTQRFTNIYHDRTVFPRPNVSTTMPPDPRMLSYGGIIQSTELPPMEPSEDSEAYDGASHNYSRQGDPQQGGTSSPDSRIMGAPPRNLGTLPRSQMDGAPIFRRNSYIVQSGDTLFSIARQTGISVEALKFANNISNSSIYIGQVLIIPSKHTVATSNTRNDNRGSSTTESLYQPQVTSSIKHKESAPIYKSPVETVPSVKINKSSMRDSSKQMMPLSHETNVSDTVTNVDNVVTPQATGISKMRWPVRGRVLSQYGQKKGTAINRGIVIAVPEGSSVKAAENGVVIYASDGLKELGNVVMIRHENDVITIYGYNSKLFVHKGQRIRRGDEIAKSGVSGEVKTPRVYFEIRKNSVPVDPVEYLEN
ncbi:peptidoglycan DD-metalloendopeptidase family protein [Bartonella heixiaziensis]|uniref:peptidoglycan DD-metalloendopeptidase family protein n=1 Tax=Bartonella heixiaziensis TaxID=1461000 RepID=UPI003908AB39